MAFGKQTGLNGLFGDCYAATLVPMMIEAGIDIWQGCMTTNNVPELIKNYGGKISFIGDIEAVK